MKLCCAVNTDIKKCRNRKKKSTIFPHINKTKIVVFPKITDFFRKNNIYFWILEVSGHFDYLINFDFG